MPSLTKVQPAFILAQGAIELDSGTASAPSLKFATSSSTGMFSPSTGALAFSTGSTQNALTILSGGNVGIGTTNPSYKLDILGDINFTGTFYQNGSPFVASRWTSGTGNNIYRLLGNVGIGTTNPTHALDVNGVARASTFISTSYSVFSSIVAADPGSNYYSWNNRIGGGLAVVGTTFLDGNVGIGTTNPSTKLDVVGNITASGSVSAAGASGFYSTTYIVNLRNPIWRFANAPEYGLSYFQGSAGVSPAGGGDTIGFHFGTPTAAASLLQLNNGSGAVINGTLGVTGNVGIGITTPASKLEVSGTITSSSGLRTLEQVRAMGWWNAPTGSSYSGLGVEMGVSSGHGYVLCYNRDNSTWGNLRLQGSGGSTMIELPASGSTINVTGSLSISSSSNTAGGNAIWHAGNDGAGSGLDADLLDGQNGTYYRQGWSSVDAGTRLDYSLGFQAPVSGYAGFYFSKSTSGASTGDAGYLLIRGTSDNDIYTAEGITLVADAGWLTLAQRTTSSRGVRIMSGTTSAERLKITTAGDIQFLNGNSLTYNGNTIWHSANDGAGSGLDADLLDGLQLHTGTNNEANKVVRTDGNGYIQAGWINTTSGGLGVTTRLDRVYTSNDGYIRYLGLTDFKNQMGLSSKNSYSRAVDYTSNSDYWVGSFGHSGYGANETFHGGSGFFDIWGGTNYPSGFTHIHGINMLHYTTNSLGSTGGVAYGWQLTTQYDSDAGPYWRRCNAGGFSNWRKIWHDTNDGAGSGLDADLLDGNNSSYFLNTSSSSQTKSGNLRVTAISESWAEGVSVSVPSAGNWGGYRLRRERGGDDGNWAFGYTALDSTDDLVFISNNGGVQVNNILRLTKTSRVGVNNSSPLQTLDVRGNFLLAADSTTATHITQKPYTINNGTLSWEGSAGQLFSITNNLTTGSIFSVNDVSGIPSIDVDANGTIELAPFSGNVGVGTTNPTTKLHVIGDILASGNVTAYSDSQLKDNVETIDKPLEKVLGLRGVTFTRVDIEDKDKKHIGVIAQEVEQVLPEVVLEHSDGIKSVAYGNMVGLLIEAIKEQQNQIESLKTEIKSLKEN